MFEIKFHNSLTKNIENKLLSQSECTKEDFEEVTLYIQSYLKNVLDVNSVKTNWNKSVIVTQVLDLIYMLIDKYPFLAYKLSLNKKCIAFLLNSGDLLISYSFQKLLKCYFQSSMSIDNKQDIINDLVEQINKKNYVKYLEMLQILLYQFNNENDCYQMILTFAEKVLIKSKELDRNNLNFNHILQVFILLKKCESLNFKLEFVDSLITSTKVKTVLTNKIILEAWENVIPKYSLTYTATEDEIKLTKTFLAKTKPIFSKLVFPTKFLHLTFAWIDKRYKEAITKQQCVSFIVCTFRSIYYTSKVSYRSFFL